MDERADPYAPPEAEIGSSAASERRHTRLGIASLAFAAISVLAVVGYFVSIGVAMFDGSSDEALASWLPFVLVSMIGGSILASFLGLALGLAGLFRVDHRRTTAVIGTLIHLGILFVYALLVVLGIAVGSQLAD